MQRHRGAPPRSPANRTQPRRWAPAFALIAVLAVAGVVAVSNGRTEPVPTVAPLPVTDGPNLAYRARLSPLFSAASAEARALVELGESRSRNLFAIRSAQGRMEERLATIDGALAPGTPPPQLDQAIDAYRSGAGTVRRAMDEAEAGFLHLDWDRVARATDLLRRGASLLDRATALLGGMPVASPLATATP